MELFLCLCRFLHSLAAAGSCCWNPGLCVWSYVHGYQHASVSPHTLDNTCFKMSRAFNHPQTANAGIAATKEQK